MGIEESWGEDALAAALSESKRLSEVAAVVGGDGKQQVGAAGAAAGGGGSFSDQWRAREEARVAEEQKKRNQTAAKARYQMSRALHAGRYGEAIHWAEQVLGVGEPLPNDLMRELIHGAASLPGGKLFAKAVSICSRGSIKFDEYGFASLIGRLLAREAPHAQVRCALNFGLRPDAEVITLEPTDCRDSEKKDCYKGVEKDDGLDPELSEDDSSGNKAPRVLEFTGCVINFKLNGMFQSRPPDPVKLGHSMPIYERRAGAFNKFFVYYHDESLAPEPNPSRKEGWYISSEVGGGKEDFAHCSCKPGQHTIPPGNGWKLRARNGSWRADTGGFRKLQRKKDVNATPEEVEVERELTILDLTKLRGAVEGRDPETCTYFAHFFVLLTLEHLTELRGFRGRWGFRKEWELVSFGLCFSKIAVDERLQTSDDSKNMPLPGWPNNGSQKVAFKLPPSSNEENVRFKASESVLVSRGDPLVSRICEGSVQNVDFVDKRLIVTLNGKLPEDPWGRLKFRLDVYANRTTYERQVTALLEFVAMKRTKICDMLVAAEVGQVDLAVLGGDGFASEKDKLGGKVDKNAGEAGGLTAEEAKAAKALDCWDDDDWFSKELEKSKRERSKRENGGDAERKAKVLKLANDDIDGVDREKLAAASAQVESMPSVSVAQKDAIGSSMSKRLTIVQGPPGTGKTHTSVRIITMWVKTMGYKPLLCTSECNIAVDNIAIGLVKNGVKVVRMGNAAKVREELEGACLGNIVTQKRKEQKEEMDEESEEIEEVGEEPWGGKDTEEWLEWDRRRMARRRKRLWESKQEKWLRSQIIEEAEVIAATTVNAGSAALNGIKFHGILIDEVAQATETSSIVPIVCRGADQLVLCGDHCQLPPSVQSREAELRGYSLSLYSRLVEAGVAFRFLDTQYRAHPMLMEFSASCIYQGKLKSGIDGSGRPSVKGVPWPNPECPAAFFECGAEEHLEGESKANEAEAKIVLKLVQGILDAGELDTDEIGVVTPYKGQVRVLRRVLHAGLKITEKQKKYLEMASVDNFQGREKEIIIFSAVRCNDYGGVGFLKDWRRLNVMITRARRGLIVIGSAVTLCYDIHWKQWLEFTEKQGGVAPGTVHLALREGERLMAEKAALKGYGKGKGKGKRKADGDSQQPAKKAKAD